MFLGVNIWGCFGVVDLISAVRASQTVALEALRDELAVALLETPSAHGKAMLSKQLFDVINQLAELAPPVERKGTGLDRFVTALNSKRPSGTEA